MNELEDIRWKNLIACSAPTFAGEKEPPYGFTTRLLAQLRAEHDQQEIMERVGMRALFASLAVLLVTVALTFSGRSDHGDLEPGLKSIIQVENVQVS